MPIPPLGTNPLPDYKQATINIPPGWTFDTYYGYRVVLSDQMTVTKTITVTRSWKDRLLSWPWRPWVRTKQETITSPADPLVLDGSRILMHPKTWEMLRKWSDEGRHAGVRKGAVR